MGEISATVVLCGMAMSDQTSPKLREAMADRALERSLHGSEQTTMKMMAEASSSSTGEPERED